MSAVIYSIRCTGDPRIYIGATKNFKNRVKHHLRQFRAGTHYSASMQKIFNSIGEGQFTFEVLEQIPSNSVIQIHNRERFYIQKYGANIFNVNKPLRWGGTDLSRLASKQRLVAA